MVDADAEVDQFADSVIATIQQAMAPLVARLARLEALPPAREGAPGQKGEDGERGPEGVPGPPGRDGRDGLSVTGQPGINGLDGKDGASGRDGLDGKDGFGFDDLVVEHDGERTFTCKFVRGDQEKVFGRFTIPVSIYRGVWAPTTAYVRGDEVTWGGSVWIAREATTGTKPGAGATPWQLAVKAGRDGKDGQPGPAGEKGATGKDGRDSTQLGPDGKKW